LTLHEDKINLCILAKHLQRRNLESLKFIQNELSNIEKFGFPASYSAEEIHMYKDIAASPEHAKSIYLMASLDVNIATADIDKISIKVLTSNLRLRSSTQPVLSIPNSVLNIPQDSDFLTTPPVQWLPLGPHFGILIGEGFKKPIFQHDDLPQDLARNLNLLYLVQLIEGISVRYCFAEDDYIAPDLVFAGFSQSEIFQSTRKKYQRTIAKRTGTWHDQVWSIKNPHSDN